MSPVPAPEPVDPGGGGHPQSLYDPVGDVEVVRAEDGFAKILDGQGLSGHGLLDTTGGFIPPGATDPIDTWMWVGSTNFNDGPWFGFELAETKGALHIGFLDFVGVSLYVQDNAVFVQFGGGGDSWDFTEMLFYGSEPHGVHLDTWASNASGGYFALYNLTEQPVFQVAMGGTDGAGGPDKLGFFYQFSAQAAHIAHATDNPTAITQLNLLLDAFQAYGLAAAA